jgi:hypothetical protein
VLRQRGLRRCGRYFVTYLDPAGRVHRRDLESGEDTADAVGAGARTAVATPAVRVYAGPFRSSGPDDAGRIPTGAWLEHTSGGGPERLTDRPALAVGGTFLIERADGQRVAALTPVEQPFSVTGLTVAELASSVLARARTSRVVEGTGIQSVALARAPGADPTLLALYTLAGDAGDLAAGQLPVQLVGFGTDGTSLAPPTALRDDLGLAGRPLAGAALMPLGPGVLGASIAGERRR